MKTTTKLGGTVALSLLALAPLAHAQETAPAETQETTKEGGHMMGGDMAGMQGMEGMEGMENMMPMMMKHMQACMEMMETMNTHMQEHHDQADQG
ncbi:hypothetical protein [Limimaricola cinnabarinus]|uniref:Multicopper oxidase n=1 Tax=Limimaricola cinnabarinus LL-001 TaxID=1337093 RepID=U3AS34_9RHOB|nr:hypothetical protein [Limimaricola cinnabarinus]GAD57548.1 hypothetical protein MBELCI_3600 [Limimaricola cinnabarinus LL-001]